MHHIEGNVGGLLSMLGLDGAVVSYYYYSIDIDYNPHGSHRSVLQNQDRKEGIQLTSEVCPNALLRMPSVDDCHHPEIDNHCLLMIPNPDTLHHAQTFHYFSILLLHHHTPLVAVVEAAESAEAVMASAYAIYFAIWMTFLRMTANYLKTWRLV